MPGMDLRKIVPALLVFTLWAAVLSPPAHAGEDKIDVAITGGHDTVGQDRGRPVVLVAGGLGVPPEIFREAFSHVHPAGTNSGGPTDAEARQNKAALMDALSKYGVTDDLLNRVSNRYRYRRDHNEMWPTSPAAAYALVRDGKVVSVVITTGGYGYSSPPVVTVPGHPEVTVQATLSFDKDLDKNGAVSALTVAPAPAGTR